MSRAQTLSAARKQVLQMQTFASRFRKRRNGIIKTLRPAPIGDPQLAHLQISQGSASGFSGRGGAT